MVDVNKRAVHLTKRNIKKQGKFKDTIIDIIVKAAEAEGPCILVEDAPAVQKNENGEIVW